MMERLRDMQQLANADEAELARLFRTLPSADPQPAMKQRVRAGLGMRPRLGPRMMRLAVAATAPASAAVVLGAAWAMYFHRGAEAPEPAASPPVIAPARVGVPAVESAPPDLPRAALLPRSPSPGDDALPARAGRTYREGITARHSGAPSGPAAQRNSDGVKRPTQTVSAESAGASQATTSETDARVATAPAEEATLVLAALRALRREHEPAKASTLLDRYLRAFPNGVLVEEAMAIAIEARLARRDEQTARRLAADYLGRFPTGRFTLLARKAAGTGP